MDNTTIAIIIAVVIVVIIIVVALVFILMPKTNTHEELIEDDIEQSDVADIESTEARYSLYVVPAIQPSLTREAKKYSGYHITIYPSQSLPEGFDLHEAMQEFKMTNQQWNLTLPGITTKVKEAKSKNLVLMMINNAKTLDSLKKFMGTKGWQRPWGAPHLTLGNISPPDQAKPEDFIHQTTFYVQLVRSPNHHWDKDQRVILNVGQGLHN